MKYRTIILGIDFQWGGLSSSCSKQRSNEPFSQGSFELVDIFVRPEVNAFVFDRAPQPLNEHVVHPPAFAIPFVALCLGPRRFSHACIGSRSFTHQRENNDRVRLLGVP